MTDILRELGMTARALDSISNVEFKAYHLTKGQYLYLVRICEAPGIIQEDLGRLILVDRSTVIRAVQKLERQGFIEKRADPTNQKIRRLFPTPAGQAIYPRIIAENRYSTRQAVAGLNADQVQQLGELLHTVRLNITADWETVKRGGHRPY